MRKRGYKLHKEEQELLDSIERGEWETVENMEAKIKKFARYAKNTLKKEKRISIRMSKQDFIGIQARAVEEGVPYQTLITSVVHKFVIGRLVSRERKEEPIKSGEKKR
ncbi:MAG: antitoxin [Candidatus Omnitrophota bacterium]|nr:antitoxin [Candidatus Omnitrophota bacterium]